ncbi:MAG: protein kinase [Verrucomicrobiota bacterium]
MNAERNCPGCGLVLPADAPRGLCPACVFELDDGTVSGPGERRGGESGATGNSLGRFGEYELLSEIARGGMGVVYRARQLTLDRIVAVKVILAGQFADKQFIQRFRGEAAAAAVLQHPNIVAIHEIGLHHGQHFFSMDFVPGRSLAEMASGHSLPARQAAVYLQAIATAVQYAHDRGILHRDLKPSNVLIDETTGQPRITDFGLAKRLDSDSSLTLTGQLLGTPNFMPPEQAGIVDGKVGRASDIYGLGAILYYLLTGRAPFQDETLEGVLRQLLNSDPVSPRLLNPAVPRDLETICLKCLEKEPSRRYGTAQAVADELRLFLNDEPIAARPVQPIERLWRWCRRKPTLAGALALALALLLVVVIGSPMAAVHINRERQRAEQEAHTTQSSLYIADMNLAQQALKEGNLGRARELLLRHVASSGSRDLRGWEWFHFQWLCRGDELAVLDRHDGEVTAVAVSPDGNWIASAGVDGKVKLRKSTPWQPAGTIDAKGRATALAFSADSQSLAALSQTAGCRVWTLATAREIAHFPVPQSYFGGALAISRTGSEIAISRGDGAVEVWNLTLRKKITDLAVNASSVLSLQFGPDDGTLLVGDDAGLIHVCNTAAGRETGRLSPGGGFLALAPDGDTLAHSASDGTVKVWSLARQQPLALLTNHTASVQAVAFSPDGTMLATAGADQTIRLWSTTNWQPVTVLRGHESVVRALAFARDGQTLVSGSRDETVRLWRVTPATAVRDRVEWPKHIAFAGLVPERREAISVHTDGLLRQWNLDMLAEMGQSQLSLDCSDLWGGSVCFNGSPLAIANHQGKVVLWDPARQREIASFQAHLGRTRCVTVSPDGRLVATSGDDSQLKLWTVSANPTLRGGTEATGTFWMAFSPNGRRLAATHEDGAVSLWPVPSLGQPMRLQGHREASVGTAFSPDGRLLATAAWDGTARVWELKTGQPLATLTGQLLGINCVMFSPEGDRLAVGSQDGTIKLWDTRLWQETATLKGHRGEVWEMAFLSDRTFVSASRDALLRWRTSEDVVPRTRAPGPR